NPKLTIPCTLTINGSPEITVNPTAKNFGTHYIGESIKDSVLITNSGCSPLVVSSIVSSYGAFAPSFTSVTIQPSKTRYLVITYSPQVIGAESGVLTITSNDDPVLVNLNGNAQLSPTISVNPTSI